MTIFMWFLSKECIYVFVGLRRRDRVRHEIVIKNLVVISWKEKVPKYRK